MGTLNWRERLGRLLFGAPEPESADEKYTTKVFEEWGEENDEVPEPVVDINYEGLVGSSIALHVDFTHRGDEVPIDVYHTSIVFDVNPDFVSERGVVNVNFHHDYGSHNLDLADLLAAGIGWEMTTWTVLKIIGYDAASKFDDFIMWKNNKVHWFLPIPDEDACSDT